MEAQETSVEKLFRQMSSGPEGLSSPAAAERLRRWGYNEIIEEKRHPLARFIGYFWGPIPWMIEVAAVLSAAVRQWEDFFLICALLFLNAMVGFFEEYKADNAIELLKKKLALRARVLRDGKWTETPARELVPGDVVRVRLGDIVPADASLVKGDYLYADESALTGESLPVEKHVPDASYSGSIVVQGEMDALVTATGGDTYFGRTTRLVSEAKVQSHFQRAVIKIGNYLIAVALMMVSVIFAVALFRGESVAEIMKFSLVLVVASIPAALPAVLTVTMAVGAGALARKEAIVSKMAAIEEMAGMDVLFSDKTGTITKNELTVGEVRPFEGFDEDDVLLYAALASREEDRDPIDKAILSASEAVMKATGGSYSISRFQPFDPVSKRTEATVEAKGGGAFRVSKGAEQAVLALLEDKGSAETLAKDVVEEFAERGFRALGVARTDEGGRWKYVGLIGIYDPPREDSLDTIKTAQSMGVVVKMVTGDHEAIAREVARQVNLGTDIRLHTDLIDRPDDEVAGAVECADGFARVFPEHKYRLVEVAEGRGHIVGMTGDGVNDAPALKKAHVGIAVAGATDAAKSAADIVFTKAGLSVIIDAIKESRKIFRRMNNYAIYRIAETVRMVLFISLSILAFNFYPVTALMIVLLALLNDAPIMTIAYDNVHYSDRPDRWDFRLVLGIATFLGVIGVAFSFALFFIGKSGFGLSRELLQSFIFLKLSVAGHMTVFVARTRGPFWSVRPSPRLLAATILTQAVATAIVVSGTFVEALQWKYALFVWCYAFGAFFITDFLKVRLYRQLEGAGNPAVHRQG